jgi:hypothetical protein
LGAIPPILDKSERWCNIETTSRILSVRGCFQSNSGLENRVQISDVRFQNYAFRHIT